MDIEMGVFNTPKENKLALDGERVEDIKVCTSFGTIVVTVVGDTKKPAILTYHDIGLNSSSQFWGFFGFSEMTAVADKFCVYHVNAPGQEDDADRLPDDFVYPTMDELAHQLDAVVERFGLKQFVGFGVGAGGNILMRYSLQNPRVVDSLILVNCNATQAGWVEWAYQKANIHYLRSRGLTNVCVDYLMWHHFGRNLDQFNADLVNSFKQYFARITNPTNLAFFLESYIRRSDLEISRDGDTLKCTVLNITGFDSPHVNDTVDLNGKLNPTNSSWLKIADCCGLVLEDAPDKVAEAVILFLQGQGYLPTFSHAKWKQSRMTSVEDIRRNSSESSESIATDLRRLRLRDVAHADAINPVA